MRLSNIQLGLTSEDSITQSQLMERDHQSEENSSPNRLELDVTRLITQLLRSDFVENLQMLRTQTPLIEKDPDPDEKLSPNWLDLPREVTLSILDKLDAFDILENVRRVCTQWESICKDPSLWRTIVFRDEFDEFGSSWYLGRMCEQAVALSCGGLVDLNLTDIGSDELLYYVTQRCTQIRRLRLVMGDFSDAGLCEAAANRLPLLEDLEISYCYAVTEKALHMFGKSCPLLKSLKMNRHGEERPQKNDTEAMAIAENMPELRRLQLFGNRLTNNGLKAILDSCSHLESLDLRQCFNINLDNSSLGKICAERIKDFRAPYDSTNDYEFDATVIEYDYEDEDEADYEDEYDDDPLNSRDVDYGCDYGSD